MSTTGLPVLDETLHLTNGWLKDLMERLHTDDRHYAYRALRAVLHAVRNVARLSNAVFDLLMARLSYGELEKVVRAAPRRSGAVRHSRLNARKGPPCRSQAYTEMEAACC